jgi:hypothetical protein
MQIQKGQESRPSLIETFCKSQPNDYLHELIGKEGLLQAANELIPGFYGGNPLQRCF